MIHKNTRRGAFIIMGRLIMLLGSLSIVMLLAILAGSFGFIAAIGVNVFGATAIAKMLNSDIYLSYKSIIIFAIICGILRGILRYLEQYFNHYIAFKILAVFRDKIFAKLRCLAPAKLENKKKGNLIAMITSDIETLEVFYAHTISPIFIALLVSTACFIFIGKFSSWILATISLCAYVTIGICIPIISSKYLRNDGVMYRKSFSSFNSFFLDSIRGVREILLYNSGESRLKEVNRKSIRMLKESRKLNWKTVKISSITDLVVTFFMLFSLMIGISLSIKERLEIGRLIIGIVTFYSSFGPVLAISSLPSNLTQTFASGDRVIDLLEETPSVKVINDGKDMESTDLIVEELHFAYDDLTKVLNGVSMHLNKGEIVGIIGPSGCGKSTFLKLLLRFWEKDSGGIFYGNQEIEGINSDNLLSNVTMVSQETYLFEGTIEENLKIAKVNASIEDMRTACKKASIHDFIMTLPKEYKTEVGELGDKLSAGEKQRIGLARAFLRGSDIILLDEPTSNVDSINEGIILKALKEQKRNKSIILVSHRESTMAIADRLYKFQNGKLLE